MSEWEDVVTTGLIGTDRRPVPDGLPASWGSGFDQLSDPAHAVLSLAARHRAASRAGDLLLSCPPGPVGPPNRAPAASRAAHEILARLLSPPQVELLNLWLVAAVQSGEQASAAYWTPLAMVAARTAELDRTTFAAAVGDRGVWFVEQNPQWARLAKDLRSRAPDEAAPPHRVGKVEVTEDAVRADPELIMHAGMPWSKQLTSTVLEIICSGQLQQRAVRYAAAVGVRLPLQHYELVRSALLTPIGLRSVREALLALERAAWLRLEMHSAFTGEPIMVERPEMPQW
jgi:hypothetical protein